MSERILGSYLWVAALHFSPAAAVASLPTCHSWTVLASLPLLNLGPSGHRRAGTRHDPKELKILQKTRRLSHSLTQSAQRLWGMSPRLPGLPSFCSTSWP